MLIYDGKNTSVPEITMVMLHGYLCAGKIFEYANLVRGAERLHEILVERGHVLPPPDDDE